MPFLRSVGTHRGRLGIWIDFEFVEVNLAMMMGLDDLGFDYIQRGPTKISIPMADVEWVAYIHETFVEYMKRRLEYIKRWAQGN